MPYDRTEPAAWWHGAERAPPMPDAPGPWVLGATAYGWAWRRTEDAPSPDTAFDPGGSLLVLDPDGNARGVQWATFKALIGGPPEVRVGDRLSHRYGSGPWTVREVADAHAVVECDGAEVPAGLHNIGRAGADKLWTLLPPDPAPDAPVARIGRLPPPGMTQTTVETASGTVTTIAATHTVHDMPAIPPERAKVAVIGEAPDDDLAGYIREGMRALDRIEAQAARQVHAGGGGGDAWTGVVRHAPDPRREALERVAEAAAELRGLVRSKPGGRIHAGDVWPWLCAALDALAALDGEAGG